MNRLFKHKAIKLFLPNDVETNLLDIRAVYDDQVMKTVQWQKKSCCSQWNHETSFGHISGGVRVFD